MFYVGKMLFGSLVLGVLYQKHDLLGNRFLIVCFSDLIIKNVKSYDIIHL